MAVKWIKAKSPGVRYHEHESRKNGVRFDRYYSIRYKLNGRDKEEGLGWASQGWTEQKAVERLAELKQNQRNGEGAQTLKEKREIRRKQEEAARAEEEKNKKESTTFGDYFEKSYLPDMTHKKSKNVEQFIYDKWIKPVIGKVKINDIHEDFHIKKHYCPE